MRRKIADVLRTQRENINVKATTEEKLGLTGREEGISAHSVVLLINKREGKDV
jgi:2-C-methyl-D-erythritol 2,4-cyclodiphosphate synthase